MTDLRRRLQRLEQSGQADPKLFAVWVRFLQGLAQVWQPGQMVDREEILAMARAEAATGRTPCEVWTQVLLEAWTQEPSRTPQGEQGV
jgi:hypothetical protein